MPFFSIIIPLFNKENFIENTLESVLKQSFSDFEVLIINDGSTDTSEEKALAFKDERIKYYLKENGGVSSARNFGIEKAQSEYITFIDADDFWYPNFLEEMNNAIGRFPELKVFSAAIEVETSKKVIPSSYSIMKTGDFEIVNYFQASSKESVIWTSCAVFHKTIFEITGVFDPKIQISEDTDLWIRIGIHYPILFSWKILARYVYDSNSVSRNLKYIMEESTFLKYSDQEKENIFLKKFMDINRFSMAIKSKLIHDENLFKTYYEAIDVQNLSLKKQILLQLPFFILNPLIHLKTTLTHFGIGNSVFK